MTLNEQQQGDDDKMVMKSDSFVSYVIQEGDNGKIDVFKTVELKDPEDAVGEYHVNVDGNGWDTYLMGSYDSIEEVVARQIDIPEHFLDQIRQKYDEILESGDAIYVGNEYGKWTVDITSRKKKVGGGTSLKEIIVKQGDEWCLKSKKKDKKGHRKNLGCYSSRKGAEDREKTVNYWKHQKG